VAVLPAHLVATPVLERIGGEAAGVVLGAGATAAWVDLDGFVVAITTREVPLLPNAVALAAGSGALQRTGAAVGSVARFAPGRINLGALQVSWDPAAPPAWDPTVSEAEATNAGPEALTGRGGSLLAALGGSGAALLGALGVEPNPDPNPDLRAVDNHGPTPHGSTTLPLRGPQRRRVGAATGALTPARARAGSTEWAVPVRVLVHELARTGLPTAIEPGGAAGLARLFAAVRERDPEPAAGAARELLGRGPGLTPEGDDLLAAVAGTLAILGPAAGWDRSTLTAFLAALVAPAPERTTALAATLLELAARRQLIEPAGRLLDLGPGGDAAWPAALARLQRLGHGSGRAYVAGIAATTSLLAAAAGHRAVP
jgi:Protein of unknown function (DUF2877)